MMSNIIFLAIFVLVISSSTNVNAFTLETTPDGRIVGGATTTIDQFPHQISLRYQNRHRCGGSIIAANAVLTAAHCVYGIKRSANMIVRAGITNRYQFGVDKAVSKTIIHENYNTNNQDYDIAILVLSSSFQYSNKIQSISLVESNQKYNDGATAIVSGWGSPYEGGPGTSLLNYVSVLLVNQGQCTRAYYPKRITKRMLCAGYSTGGRDSCQGDSGGPLIIMDSGNMTLIGVVSWGYGCARPSYPGVYANVAQFRSWISKNVQI